MDGEVGPRGAHIDDQRGAILDGRGGHRDQLRSLGLIVLEHLRSDRETETVHAGRQVELDLAFHAFDVEAPVLEERREQNRYDAFDPIRRHDALATPVETFPVFAEQSPVSSRQRPVAAS